MAGSTAGHFSRGLRNADLMRSRISQISSIQFPDWFPPAARCRLLIEVSRVEPPVRVANYSSGSWQPTQILPLALLGLCSNQQVQPPGKRGRFARLAYGLRLLAPTDKT